MNDQQYNEVKSLINGIMRDIGRIADVMTQPESRAKKAVDIMLAAVGIGGGVTVVDQVIRWITG
ncbi:MAG: hypothetical protein LBC77_02055 [Spirochaetaceae bacterium]|jgi:hypothetical protein|nr:hypothetical protein [Spirochaetaceae bacterium]